MPDQKQAPTCQIETSAPEISMRDIDSAVRACGPTDDVENQVEATRLRFVHYGSLATEQ